MRQRPNGGKLEPMGNSGIKQGGGPVRALERDEFMMMQDPNYATPTHNHHQKKPSRMDEPSLTFDQTIQARNLR